MSGFVQGTQVKAALKKSAVWGTAVAVGAGDGLWVRTPGDAIPEREEVPDEAVGQIGPSEVDYGNTTAGTDDIVGDMYYEGEDTALALVLGTAGAPTTPSSGSTARQHLYKVRDTIQDLFATYAVKRGAAGIFEFPSVKLHGFEISGEAGQPLSIALKNIKNTLARTGQATTAAAFDSNVTFPNRKDKIMFNQGVYLLNLQSAGALSSPTDKIRPRRVMVSFIRALEGDHVGDGNDYVDQPEETGFIEALLEVEFPQFGSGSTYVDNYLAASNLAKALWKFEMTFTGRNFDGSDDYLFKVQIPAMHLIRPESSTDGPGKIAETLRFRILRIKSDDTVPAGMGTIRKFLQLTAINKRTTDPLA